MKISKVTMRPKDELTHHEKLVLSGAIDLRDNHTVEKKGHYIVIKPIDKNKKFK